MGVKRSIPDTERVNNNTRLISSMSIRSIVEKIHSEDLRAYSCVGKAVAKISKVIERALECVKSGGRIIYVGAGTSGRIGAQDAIEMWPTYGLGKETFDYVIAGGKIALTRSIEGAEDSEESAVRELRKKKLTDRDCVIGISASGRTPFVMAALKEAKSRGCFTAAIVNSRDSPLKEIAEVVIFLNSGPEVIQGSTRMKAGTSQKMVLNIISTTIAIKLGRTYGNRMFHMRASYNKKLRLRAVRMISERFRLSESNA
ncbi:MAG: N-acetylmuramic acid 6-phosphate etherase, partial [Conexivisphaerales archaeon]